MSNPSFIILHLLIYFHTPLLYNDGNIQSVSNNDVNYNNNNNNNNRIIMFCYVSIYLCLCFIIDKYNYNNTKKKILII